MDEGLTINENHQAYDQDRIILRVNIVTLKEKRAIDAPLRTPIWYMKKQLCSHIRDKDEKNVENFGFFLLSKPNHSETEGKWLRESLRLDAYFGKVIHKNIKEFDVLFIPKVRYVDYNEINRNASKDSNKNRKKFMMLVSKGIQSEVYKYCDKGFDPNFRDKNGNFPLLAATLNDDPSMITCLICAGAFVDYRMDIKNKYATALHVAVSKCKKLALDRLIKHGAWIDMEDSENRTPLHYAVSTSDPYLLINVLTYKPKLNHKDCRGWTPLHLACANNDETCTIILIDNSAKINATNNIGNTPLHVAVANNTEYCVDYLLIRGCERNLLNRSNQTPLQISITAGYPHIKKKLLNFEDKYIVHPPPHPIYNGNRIVVSPDKKKSLPIQIDKQLIYKSIIQSAYGDDEKGYTNISIYSKDNSNKISDFDTASLHANGSNNESVCMSNN